MINEQSVDTTPPTKAGQSQKYLSFTRTENTDKLNTNAPTTQNHQTTPANCPHGVVQVHRIFLFCSICLCVFDDGLFNFVWFVGSGWFCQNRSIGVYVKDAGAVMALCLGASFGVESLSCVACMRLGAVSAVASVKVV